LRTKSEQTPTTVYIRKAHLFSVRDFVGDGTAPILMKSSLKATMSNLVCSKIAQPRQDALSRNGPGESCPATIFLCLTFSFAIKSDRIGFEFEAANFGVQFASILAW
jgi:hypothetical protein